MASHCSTSSIAPGAISHARRRSAWSCLCYGKAGWGTLLGMSTSILVIGGVGQVAHELRRGAWPAGFAVDFLGRPAVDLTRPVEVRDKVIAARPDIVVNAAAYTAVDAAEGDRDTAFAVNRNGPAALAEACREVGAALVHYSTDYVYEGTKTGAHVESDPINPLSVY